MNHPTHMVHQVIAEEQSAWRARLARMETQRLRGHGHHRSRSYFHPLTPPLQTAAKAVTRTSCPWDAGVTTDEHGITTFRFTRAGVLRGAGLPTNMFDSSGNLFSTVVGSSLVYVQLHCMTDGAEVTSCEITTSSTPAAPVGVLENAAPAEFWLDLHVVADGTALKVVECANLLALPVVTLVTEKEDPVCAGDPHVRHYTWQVTGVIEA